MSADSGSGPDLDLVQVGPIEVDPAVLGGSGSSLWDLIGDRRVEMRSPDEVLDLPRHGWRRLVPSRDDGAGSREVFAAPHGQVSEAWTLVFLSDSAGAWRVSTHPGPIRVHRCRAARRVGLELRWPGEFTCKAGALPGVSIDLVNAGDRMWVNYAGDHMTVHGWVLDEEGEPMKPGLSLFSQAPTLPDIEPGDRISLRVDIATRDIEDFTPGRYAVIAELHDLGLTSSPGTLILVDPTPGT
ncbi:hypothetical protein M2275_000790 [Rhodococcus opacus]|nr:hypothetical protein [Rhodococcus opacus]